MTINNRFRGYGKNISVSLPCENKQRKGDYYGSLG